MGVAWREEMFCLTPPFVGGTKVVEVGLHGCHRELVYSCICTTIKPYTMQENNPATPNRRIAVQQIMHPAIQIACQLCAFRRHRRSEKLKCRRFVHSIPSDTCFPHRLTKHAKRVNAVCAIQCSRRGPGNEQGGRCVPAYPEPNARHAASRVLPSRECPLRLCTRVHVTKTQHAL